MEKKRRLAFVAVTILVVAGLVWGIFGPGKREPYYQGKPLSQYLDRLATNYAYRQDWEAQQAIYRMGPAAIPPLRQALHRKESYRERALRFLHAHLPKNVAHHLPATNSDYYYGALAAESAQCLALFGPKARSALPDLIGCFNQPLAGYSAGYAAMDIGLRSNDLPQLLPLLKSTNDFAPLLAAQCIARIGETNGGVIEALTNLAGSGSHWVRSYVVDELKKFGPKASAAVPLLSANLDAGDPRLRIASAEALWKIQGQSNPPVAWFIKELDKEINHGSPSVLATSNSDGAGTHEIVLMDLTAFLGEQGTNFSDAVPHLRRLKNDPDIRLRLGASQALWKIAGETNDYLAIHFDATNYTAAILQWSARQLMDFCLEQRVVAPQLEGLLASKDPSVTVYSARALWKVKGDSARTVIALTAALDDNVNHVTYRNPPEIRQLAAETLGEMGSKAETALPSLTAALDDPHENVRCAATNALKQIDPVAAAKAGVK
jgi:HEAT repeat protein